MIYPHPSSKFSHHLPPHIPFHGHPLLPPPLPPHQVREVVHTAALLKLPYRGMSAAEKRELVEATLKELVGAGACRRVSCHRARCVRTCHMHGELAMGGRDAARKVALAHGSSLPPLPFSPTTNPLLLPTPLLLLPPRLLLLLPPTIRT